MAASERSRYSSAVSSAAFVEVKPVGTAAVARIICNAIGQREAPIIEAELKGAITRAAGKVVLDMSAVTVLGSMGLGMLVTLTKQCQTSGGKLAIFGMNNSLLELLKLTRLDKFLMIAKDEASALSKVG